MAHESFEKLAIIAVMNELFVNIKVDREERPDIVSLANPWPMAKGWRIPIAQTA
jgi:uncharacterized protein YyaL (SSP411 family)